MPREVKKPVEERQSRHRRVAKTLRAEANSRVGVAAAAPATPAEAPAAAGEHVVNGTMPLSAVPCSSMGHRRTSSSSVSEEDGEYIRETQQPALDEPGAVSRRTEEVANTQQNAWVSRRLSESHMQDHESIPATHRKGKQRYSATTPIAGRGCASAGSSSSSSGASGAAAVSAAANDTEGLPGSSTAITVFGREYPRSPFTAGQTSLVKSWRDTRAGSSEVLLLNLALWLEKQRENFAKQQQQWKQQQQQQMLQVPTVQKPKKQQRRAKASEEMMQLSKEERREKKQQPGSQQQSEAGEDSQGLMQNNLKQDPRARATEEEEDKQGPLQGDAIRGHGQQKRRTQKHQMKKDQLVDIHLRPFILSMLCGEVTAPDYLSLTVVTYWTSEAGSALRQVPHGIRVAAKRTNKLLLNFLVLQQLLARQRQLQLLWREQQKQIKKTKKRRELLLTPHLPFLSSAVSDGTDPTEINVKPLSSQAVDEPADLTPTGETSTRSSADLTSTGAPSTSSSLYRGTPDITFAHATIAAAAACPEGSKDRPASAAAEDGSTTAAAGTTCFIASAGDTAAAAAAAVASSPIRVGDGGEEKANHATASASLQKRKQQTSQQQQQQRHPPAYWLLMRHPVTESKEAGALRGLHVLNAISHDFVDRRITRFLVLLNVTDVDTGEQQDTS